LLQPGGIASLVVPHMLMNTLAPCSLTVLITNLHREGIQCRWQGLVTRGVG
jgi:hypothetical protein